MKKLKQVLLSILLVSSVASAQIVTLAPTIVTQNDTVTITFDASQGNAGLLGVSPVYMHTGVVTNLSSSPTDWRHVQGNWGTADPKVLMTDIGNNKHQLTYHINSFYNVPSNETVQSLAFVFRNVDGSKEGKTAANGDIFVPISQGGFTGGFVNLAKSQNLIQKGDSVELAIAISDSSAINLYQNGLVVAQDSGATSLNYWFKTAGLPAGKYTFVAEAISGTQTIFDTVSFVSRGGTPIGALPSYSKEGISYLNDSTVYLQLRAPFKEFIYVVGDFNNWEYDPEYEMTRTPNGDYFFIEISGLDKQTEYGFQYSIGFEEMRVTDPYVEKILDPWNDAYIANSTYPNLKPYPVDKTTETVGVLQIEEPAYNWQVSNFSKPAVEELVIYELLIRDFHQDHTYNAVIEKLDYLEGLGVNAIELMPVMEFEGNESWGYNPSFMFAPDKYYGPKNELKRLVDSCHSRGIAVILDIVLNHQFGQSPMVRMYFDANAGQWGQPSAQNPWFNQVPKHEFNVGYDFNHESPDTKRFTKAVFQHWIDEYKIDGYRLDLSKGFTQKNTLGSVSAWGQYDQSRIDILSDYAHAVWQTDATAYFILEHFAENSEETVLSDDGQLLWGNNNHEYNEATMGYSSNINGVSHQSRNWPDMHLVSYMESHDEERLMYKNINYGNANSNYSASQIDTALQRMALAAAFFYTVPGPKMLWQFGELGYDFSINHCPDGTIDPSCRVANKPIKWNYYTEANRKELFDIIAELNHLRQANPVFSYDANHEIMGNTLAKRIKLVDTSLQVVIIGNFDVVDQSINPEFHASGWWYNHFTRDSLLVTNTNAPVVLQPGEWHLFTSRKIASTISVHENKSTIPMGGVKLFPNPSHNGVNFIAEGQEHLLEITVNNVAGVPVFSTRFTDNSHGYFWDFQNKTGNKIASGVYIVTMRTNYRTTVEKLIVY